jgi:diguanylate cyclase (GGDEF)-like protein
MTNSPARDAGLRALFVYTDEKLIDKLVGQLSAHGQQGVLTAANGISEGLRVLGAERYDVVLFEAHTAVDLAKGLSRLRDLFPHVPVVVLSSSQDMALCERALHDGAQDFLVTERSTSFELARAIHYAVERHRVHAAQDRRIKELAADVSRFRLLIENSGDGLLVVTEEGTVLFANPAALHALGRPEAEIVGQPFGFPVIQGGPVVMDVLRKDRETSVAEMSAVEIFWEGETAYLVSLRDITARAEREREQRRQVDAERLVSSMSTLFANLDPKSVDHGIEECLRMLGEFVNADRVSVFLFSRDGHMAHPRHEWGVPGLNSEPGESRDLPMDSLSWLLERLSIFNTALISDVNALPRDAIGERELLGIRATRSLVAVAMRRNGERLGFACLESVRAERMWSEEEIGLLKVAVDLIAAALHRKRSAIEGLALRALLDALMTSDARGAFVEDRKGVIVQANARLADFAPMLPALNVLCGMSVYDVHQRISHEARDPGDAGDRLKKMAQLESMSGERLALASGAVLEFETHPLRVRDKFAGRLWRVWDVTREYAEQRALEGHVRRDGLTGLSTRQRFIEDAGLLLDDRSARDGAALLLIDFDALGSVNATFGMVVGDEVLRQAARRISECCRSSDIVGRFGGDEFGVLLSVCPDLAEAESTARRLLGALQAPYQIGAATVRVGASLGGVHAPAMTGDAVKMFLHAQEALSQAKEQGGGQFIFAGQSSCTVRPSAVGNKPAA